MTVPRACFPASLPHDWVLGPSVAVCKWCGVVVRRKEVRPWPL